MTEDEAVVKREDNYKLALTAEAQKQRWEAPSVVSKKVDEEADQEVGIRRWFRKWI